MTDWVRLWHDMPTDPKWRVIARKSGQPLVCVIAVFNLMMISASQNADDRGVLSSWDDEDAAAALDMEAEQIVAIMAAMQGKVIVDQRLTGWDKRQPKREDGTAAQRKAAWKERKAQEQNAAERNGTHWNAPETDAETETEVKAYAFTARVVRLTPKDYDDWRNRFSAIPDFDAELHACDAWLLTQPEAKQKKWFGSAASWLADRHQRYTANRQRAGPLAVVGI